MKVNKWMKIAQKENEWKRVIGKAKTLVAELAEE